MKKTKLYEIHKSLGANMTNFAGYEMPISYGSIMKEHNCVRNSVGVFDVSHMGEFLVEGGNAENFLQYCCSNDVKKLFIGRAQYNYFANLNGGIIDDLIVYKLEENKFLLVVNASNIQKDWEHLNFLNKKFNVELKNISNNISLLSIQGPNSTKLLNKISDFNFGALNNYMNCVTNIAGIKKVIVGSTGYTGAVGYEIYCDNKNVKQIWDTLFNEGKEFNVLPIGLAARDSLRIEMGYCLYGNEIDENTSPIQAGLSWITKTETNFYGSNRINEDIENGCKYMIIGIKSEERMIPRNGDVILNSDKNEIGKITSGTFSPTLKIPIGIGFIFKDNLNYDDEIFVNNKRKTFKAKISSLPFIRS
ncbi:MAG: glycine cleavage system protein T [Flavobacteriaceae bacterium]|nr:glycine cleavage system protein T [Flavobacteriaceae bacterium]|tara:strand:+ start:75 stop:1160 length:1086 start_codon:yes stop_codon:yes gene_type:complete